MPRIAIDKARIRADLTPQREPYWAAPLARGLYLGFRKLTEGGTWIARWRDPETGKQHFHSLGPVTGLSYDAAVTAARTWAKARADGLDDGEVRTVADACAAYVKDRRREKGDAAAEVQAATHRCHINAAPLGAITLAKVRSADLKAWRATLPMRDVSKNRVMSALKAALNHAVRERYLDAGRSIEWASVKNLTAHARRDLYLDRAQRRALVDACPADAQPFLRALSLLPIRCGALAQATVANLDATHGVLKIARDKSAAGRTIPLSAAALALLKEQAKGKLPGAPLIAYRDGSAWHKDRWKEIIQQARDTAGLPAATCAYTLRHSVITDLLSLGGMDVLTVARIAGTSIVQIEKHYGHLLKAHAVEAMNRIEL